MPLNIFQNLVICRACGFVTDSVDKRCHNDSHSLPPRHDKKCLWCRCQHCNNYLVNQEEIVDYDDKSQ